MLQAFEIKQETRARSKRIVTVMLYGSSGSFSGHDRFGGLEIVGADWCFVAVFVAMPTRFLFCITFTKAEQEACEVAGNRFAKLLRVSTAMSKPSFGGGAFALSASCV